MDRRSVGVYGENYAVAYLISKGYTILNRNVRFASGEIDIICRHTSSIIAVEVKTRLSNRMGEPFESVGTRKVSKIMRTFVEYLRHHPATGCTPRIDVISLVFAYPDKIIQLQHFKNITF